MGTSFSRPKNCMICGKRRVPAGVSVMGMSLGWLCNECYTPRQENQQRHNNDLQELAKLLTKGKAEIVAKLRAEGKCVIA